MFKQGFQSAADPELFHRPDNEQFLKFKCKISCCTKCSFCTRASAKERFKSRSVRLSPNKISIKICEKCFLCHSIVVCQSCLKCPKCCSLSACRGPSSKILEKLVETGCRPESSSNLKRGLHPPLPGPAKTHKVSDCHKVLCQSPEEQLPTGGITSAYRQKYSRTGHKQNISELFQQTFPSPKTKQQVASYFRPQPSKPISQDGEIQDGDARNHQDIPPRRGVGNLYRFQRRLLPHPNTRTIQEVSEVSCPGANIPVQSLTFRPVHSTLRVHCNSKGGKADGHLPGYKDPPIPRRLVGPGWIPPTLSPAYPASSEDMSRFRLASKFGQVGAGTQANLRLCRLPVRPQGRSGPADSGPVAKPSRKDSRDIRPTDLSGPAVHVPHWPVNGHREASSPRSTTHATYTVAPQEQLARTGITRKSDPHPRILTPSPTVVVTGRKRAIRPTFTPSQTCSAALYRRIKRRLGRSLKRPHCKRLLVLTRKQTAYQLLGAKGSSSCSQRVHRSLYRSNSTCGNRQLHSSFLHKQRRRHEIRPPVCPSLENPDLVFPAAGNLKSPSHSRPAKCNSGQAIPSGSDHSDRVVPSDRSVSDLMPKVAPTSDRPIRYEVQPQAAPVCISSTGLPSGSSGCPHSVMGGPGCLCLPANSHIGQSSGKVNTLPVQENHSDCPGLAQHGLVLGLGEHVQPSSHLSAHPAKPVNSTLQSDPSQESDKSEPACMAPRATAIKQQGFSEAVAERIEAPQRRSTRSVYEAKWAVFTKWCIANQVDFRSPPVKSVADFLLYLFEDKNLQPSTIDGYRSAIADKLGSTTVNISKDENLTRLLESFHRDRPKGRRGIPSWNLSLVLHQLTKAPFEPLRDASLKHLTLKTVFLLALGSGKRRSEIHAWQHKNIRHQTDWSKVSLYPSPSFLSKNQLAREGPESVAPVVIPALAPTLDRSLKSDRSLCPVRALRYYLDRTSDTRQGKDLVFVSFKKGFDKDISPATISSWIKQTVILCYELSDHHAHTLHQVKVHDIRAFAASKAFQSGVSLEQILSACHWKSHNTFTQFYLKDVAWADSELFHLGPVVAAQQIHQQTGT